MKMGKTGCFATSKKANLTILIALVGHGQRDEPSEEGLRGCEEFICSHFCPHWGSIYAQVVFSKQLRVEQGVDKLPATHGAWIDHMRRARFQANIWYHDMVLQLTCPDPLTMRWRYLDQNLVPVLSH